MPMVDDCCGGNDPTCGCGGEACGCSGDGRAIGDGGAVVDISTPAEEEAIGQPPALSGPEWEEWAEAVLDETEFDTDLGKDLARDALNVAEGKLSKAEFHERHGDDVEAEFGIDERPTKDAVGDPDEPVPRVPSVSEPSEKTRRNMLKLVGGAAAIGASGGLAGCIGSYDSEKLDDAREEEVPKTTGAQEDSIGDPDREVQLGMVVDTDACIACLQCSLACKEENNTSVGVHWPYVFRYEDEVEGETREGELTRHCQHCSRASCTFVCPTEARHKREEDGIVLTDYDLCVGCKYCQVACPYGVNYLGADNPTDLSDGFNYYKTDRNGRRVAGPPPKGVMGKCTYCVHRQDSDNENLQGTTACEQRCPANAIHFGDMNDPESDPRTYLRGESPGREDIPEKNWFKLLEQVGNEPNVVFVGKEPSNDAEPIEGPVAYEDHGMVGGNYDFDEEGEHQ